MRNDQRVTAEHAARALTDHPWCSECGSTRRLMTEYVIPLRLGGRDEPQNVAVVCARCSETP